MKATARTEARASMEVTFEGVRRVAESAPKRQAMELKAPSYGKWIVGDGDAAVEVTLTAGGEATTINTTAWMPKVGAGATWSMGIFAPIVMPFLYFKLRGAANSVGNNIKRIAEDEMVSSRQKLKGAQI